MHPIGDLKHDSIIRWSAALNIPNFEIIWSSSLKVIYLAEIAQAHDDTDRHDHQSPVLVEFNLIAQDLTFKLDVGLGILRRAIARNILDISEETVQVEVTDLLTPTYAIKLPTQSDFINHG